jgi:hypothetical protein
MDRTNDVKAAFGDGVNNTDTAAYTVATGAGSGTGRVDAIPVGWYGEFLQIISVGADSRFYFTKNVGAVIDPAVAPSATGGLSPQRGELAPAGVIMQFLCPTAGPSETVYLARASTGAPTSFEVSKRSGKPGNNTVRDS